jgi:CheY-like chemotaxis protein
VYEVLPVDDDDAVRDMMTVTLLHEGFWVVAAANVTEALKLSTTETFDVLITDLHMPNPCPSEITEQGPKRRIVEMAPYEGARRFSRGGKYTKREQDTRTKSGRLDTGRQYIPRQPVLGGNPIWKRSIAASYSLLSVARPLAEKWL